MANPRFLMVLGLLAALALLAVQNISPALPLVFLGVRTPAFALAFWLVGAIALGALTTLVLTALISGGGAPPGSRRFPNRSGRRIAYDPEAVSTAAQDVPAGPRGRDRASPRGSSRAPSSDATGEWGEWTSLQSPGDLNDWGQVAAANDRANRQAPGRSQGDNPPRPSWWGGRREAEQTQRVDQSWQELSDGWDELEDVRYRPRGVSPVEDALDDLEEGWNDGREGPSPRAYDSGESSKRVYHNGSIYSDSYPDRSDRRLDDVYGPEDEDDWQPEGRWSESGEYPQDREPDQAFDDDDGSDEADPDSDVVDAEFRVIIPPYKPIDLKKKPDDDDDDGSWIDD